MYWNNFPQVKSYPLACPFSLSLSLDGCPIAMAVLWQHDVKSINKPFGTFNPPQAYRKSQIQKGLLIDLLLYFNYINHFC